MFHGATGTYANRAISNFQRIFVRSLFDYYYYIFYDCVIIIFCFHLTLFLLLSHSISISLSVCMRTVYHRICCLSQQMYHLKCSRQHTKYSKPCHFANINQRQKFNRNGFNKSRRMGANKLLNCLETSQGFWRTTRNEKKSI